VTCRQHPALSRGRAYTLGACDRGIIRPRAAAPPAPEIAEILRSFWVVRWTYVIVAELIGSSSGSSHDSPQPALLNTAYHLRILVIGLNRPRV